MSELTVDQAIQLALQHQQAGQLAEAEEIFRQILDVYPDQADALHLLGGLYFQAKRSDLAEARVRQAIGVRGEPAYTLTLGIILQSEQRFAEALELYKALIASKPDFVDGHIHMGVVLSILTRFDEAAAAFQEALRLEPGNVTAQGNLGIVLCHLQRFDEAIWVLQSAIGQTPKNADLHASLGAAYYGKGQMEPALTECKEAVALNAQHGQAQNLISLILRGMGKKEEAIEPARKAAQLMPDMVDVQVNYGEALRQVGKLDEAAAQYEKAIRSNLSSNDLHNNLGNVYKDQGLLEEAIGQYRKSLAIRMTPAILSNLIYSMQYSPKWTTAEVFEELQRYEEVFGKSVAKEIQPHGNVRDANRRLKIGYISGEFRQHALGLNLVPLLTRHDKSQFEVYLYSSVEKPDFYTYRIRQCADHWEEIRGKTDAEVADLVRRDGIDILIDLHQHMAGNRLPVYARKPAPVQIAFAGYPGSTGLTAMDYRLTDPYLDPPEGGEQLSSEVALRLPHSFWCYHPVTEVEVNELPALSKGEVTFGNLNNFCKFNEETFQLWIEAMRAVQGSRLLLLAPEGSTRKRTQAYFKAAGIDPARVQFVGRAATGEYYKYYHQIDLGLDSFPCNGHTTSMDSFWMGVPVTSMLGATLFGRATWSQAVNLGLRELVGKNGREFVEISVGLAKDLPRLAELRRSLRERMKGSPLMDEAGFAKGIEAAYREAWRRCCEKAG